MTTGKTKLLYRGNTATTGEAIQPQRVGNQTGTIQCDFTDSGATQGFKMEIRGRATAASNWVVLHTFTEDDRDANDAILASVRLMPYMTAEVVSVTGSPPANSIEAWLIE